MTTDYQERPLDDEQLPSELPDSDDQSGNAYCADCGYELPYPCAHCAAQNGRASH